MDNMTKKNMIEQRLNEYDQKIFSLEMDLVALESIGDKESAKKVQEVIEGMKKAREAVEGML